jgi:hypothetical protein
MRAVRVFGRVSGIWRRKGVVGIIRKFGIWLARMNIFIHLKIYCHNN